MKLKRRLKYYLIRLFRLKASPHKVALGLALGFAPNWFPTFGLGPLLSVGLAKLTKVNLIAAIVGGVIGTPLWPVLFLLNYRSGSLFFMRPSKVREIGEVGYLDTVGSLHSDSLQYLTGTLFNVLLSSLLIYLIVYLLFKKQRFNILLKIKCW